ncbi:MAG TPA: antitoxin [Thermoanaerobaculia bacterium]|nr:antitoxin [Thermoanaerobaculia bacterium]
MRTTLTLESDVAAAIKAAQRRTGATHKQIVNDALRRGLLLAEKSPKKPKRYVTVPLDPGKPAVEGVHSVYDLLAFAEGEDFR